MYLSRYQLPYLQASNQSTLSFPHRDQPGALHLSPCTLEQYRQLGNANEDRYELVDGLLVAVPAMGDPEHGKLVTYLFVLFTLLPDTIPNPVQAYSQVSYLLSTGAEGHSRRRDTIRIPDLYAVLKSEESYSSDVADSPFEGQRHANWNKAQLVVEVTSTNRNTDLVPKLEDYRQAKIPEYVIIDRQKAVQGRHPCVEVHKLNRRGDYTKRVYYGNQQVDCSYFSHWNLTADNMLDFKFLRRICEREKKKRDRAEKERERQEKRADRAEKERDHAKKERERQEKRADLAEKEREEDRRHWIDFVKGQRLTPPPGLEPDDSQLKYHNASSYSLSAGSSKRRSVPKSPSTPKSPTPLQLRLASSSSTMSPKSPTSPPHRVRRVDHSDVKRTSRNDKDQRESKRK